MRRRAEAQRVHRRDRPRAHGEDVAQDAADAGRRALIGLDEGGVVVALHLEDDASPSPISTTPAFSPGPWMTRGPVGQRAQPFLGGFVRAVLVPHGREDAEFGEGRLAADQRGCADIRPASARATRSATSVRVRDGKTETMDGPFAETKEHLGGYYLMECADLDEAIKWAAQIPGAKLRHRRTTPHCGLWVNPHGLTQRSVPPAGADPCGKNRGRILAALIARLSVIFESGR
jgi:hypothetical protein